MTLYEKLYKRINDIQDIAHFDHLSIDSSNASIEVTKLCLDEIVSSFSGNIKKYNLALSKAN